ncbi:recombinase family protein [Saccharibacillus sp. CPCC 101409]|uniref:recombinase family protein n=1 Tax=Saccharibacillus sp. CPCC 101409 TaxID=3058041 RepID=UPI002672063B|nr:recombinase family protein [Saccharibacillus sp. CPCC 101409]MDO3411491.1 recombinase family protein [Saccharibacillus sp. CPCC 101409]
MNVVTYLRVSSEQQAERELSIPAQREALQRYADERGWNIVAEYIDEARSAKTDERPAFQQMISIAQKTNKTFEAIVVHKFDRFSRSRADHAIYKALLKKQGVAVVSVSEPIEADTPHGFLLESMLEIISEFYNVNLRHETLKGMRENATQGFHCGGRAPYGYRLDRQGRKVNYKLGPNEEVVVVRRAFELAAQGYGGKKLAKELNVYNTDLQKRWSPSTVLSMLRNPAYLGHRVWNRKAIAEAKRNPEEKWIVTKDTHPAIVNQKVWDAAQASLDSRKHKSN